MRSLLSVAAQLSLCSHRSSPPPRPPRRAVFASLFADLRLLRAADAFVGTSASWTSRLALLAITGETGALPPFELLDKPLGQLWFA